MAEHRLPADLAQRLVAGDAELAVTGASGWFGRATLALLHDALGERAFAARVRAFASAARPLRVRQGLDVPLLALDDLATAVGPGAIVLHYAYVTRERIAERGHDAYVAENLQITLRVLELVETHPPAALVYLSSGAVYGRGSALETDLAANPYGALKHLDELSLRAAAEAAGARAVVARVFAVAGPYLQKVDVFALSDLVRQGLAGGPLRVRARGDVRRSYAAVGDVVAVALAEALRDAPEPGPTFDAAGPEVVEMGELAERVRATLRLGDVRIERERDPGAPADDYFGDARAFEDLAHGHGIDLLTLDEQIELTARDLASGP